MGLAHVAHRMAHHGSPCPTAAPRDGTFMVSMVFFASRERSKSLESLESSLLLGATGSQLGEPASRGSQGAATEASRGAQPGEHPGEPGGGNQGLRIRNWGYDDVVRLDFPRSPSSKSYAKHPVVDPKNLDSWKPVVDLCMSIAPNCLDLKLKQIILL